MSLKSSFATDWPGFIADWCLGVVPGYTPEEVELAVEALEQEWPERLIGLHSSTHRSIILIAPLIDDGLVISRCQVLRRFAPVMARVRAGSLAALSELRLAVGLVQLGYAPELEPPLGNKFLDALIIVAGMPIYFEAIAPEVSDAMQEAQAELKKLAESIAQQNPGMYTELHLTTDITPDIARDALARATELLPSASVTAISSLGLVRKVRIEVGNAGIVPVDAQRPVLFAGFGGIEGEQRSMAVVTVSLSDARAARLMEAETKHFSRDKANILAIDVTQVPSGIKSYTPLIERRFQPNFNLRFGAVVLFSRVLQNARVEQKWKALPNPHALIEIPTDLLRRFESLSTEPHTA